MATDAPFDDLLRRKDFDAAFRVLYGTYAAPLERFVRSRRRAPSVDPEGVCQQVWIEAKRGLPRLSVESTPKAWLFAIAWRRLADANRNERRFAHDPLEADVLERRQQLLTSLPAGPRRPSTPYTKAVRARRAAVLHRVLAAWKPEDRELLELRFEHGFTPAEIVTVLGLADRANSVSQRLVRLSRRLRDELSEQEDFEPEHR